MTAENKGRKRLDISMAIFLFAAIVCAFLFTPLEITITSRELAQQTLTAAAGISVTIGGSLGVVVVFLARVWKARLLSVRSIFGAGVLGMLYLLIAACIFFITAMLSLLYSFDAVSSSVALAKIGSEMGSVAKLIIIAFIMLVSGAMYVPLDFISHWRSMGGQLWK